MSPENLQREQQEAVNDSPLRGRLLREISGTWVRTNVKRPHPAAGARDLNMARLARRVNALFNQRWLGGFGGRTKTQAQPKRDPASPRRGVQHH